MGLLSTTKLIKNNAGSLTEETILTTSAGAADSNKVVALNASGILDSTIVNSKTTSAGASDSGKIPALDGTGRIDASMMPVGVTADTASLVASEALSAGNLVNVWSNAGVANVRKADGSTSGKEAHGYVLTAVAAAGTATVYFQGQNTQCVGLTPGVQYLSGVTAGVPSSTAAVGTGKIVQVIGFAFSSTAMNIQCELPIVLA
jgi:hypothetical protein